jgi:formamidopyrimidine-DNA glycosylase
VAVRPVESRPPMPEAPDLVVIREYLLPHPVGDVIVGATERKPLVLRNMIEPAAEFEADIKQRRVESLERQGKLLIVGLSGDQEIVISPMLTGGRLVSGIGNAYADEILHEAMIYPFKKVTRLSGDELASLHRAVYSVPAAAVETLRERVGNKIHRKFRDFLKVHGKKNDPCPRCGNKITAITAHRRETNYCRRCQPGFLLDV